MGRKAILVVVSGPSGSGKTTLVQYLLQRVPHMLFSVSYTTRAPRAGEQNGCEYHFISRSKFEAMIGRREFLEYAQVFDDYYGTHRRYVDQASAKGKDLILDIDVQGAAQLLARKKDAVFVFVLPPSCDDLKQRLRARGLDAAAAIERRLEFARREIERIDSYEYVVINTDRDEACQHMEALVEVERARRSIGTASQEAVQRAETCRRAAQAKEISAILETFRVPTP